MQDTQPIREFDHLMCGVKDLGAVGGTFEALGFTVGPITPLEGVGVANRRILLTPQQENIANYLEFMQLGGASGTIPSYLNKWLATSLHGDEGVHSFIMRSDNARATYAYFEERHKNDPNGGFSPILLEQDFEQPGPDGITYNVGFSNCIMPDLEPPLYVSTSEIRTLDFYLDSKWRSHPNGAVSWLSSIAVSDDPMGTAKGLQNVWAGTVEQQGENTVVACLKEMPLRIFTPEGLHNTYGVWPKVGKGKALEAPYSVGAHISVVDIKETKEFLLSQNINVIVKNDYVIIPPELAHGVLLCFEQDTIAGRP